MQDTKLHTRSDDDIDCVLAIDRAAFNQGKNAKYDFSIIGGGIAQTVIAKGPGAVCYRLQISAATTNRTGKGGDRNG